MRDSPKIFDLFVYQTYRDFVVLPQSIFLIYVEFRR